MSSNSELLKTYIKTRDVEVLGQILENSQNIVVTAIKAALRKKDIDDSRFEEYQGCAYIYLADRLGSLDKNYNDDSAFYRYIFNACVHAVNKEIDREREIAENEVSLYSFRDCYETLEKEGLVDDSLKEIESNVDLEFFKKIVFSKSTGLTKQQKECMIAHYGLDGKEPVSVSEIAMQRNVTRIEVYHLMGSGLVKIRRELEKGRHRAKIYNIMEESSPKKGR